MGGKRAKLYPLFADLHGTDVLVVGGGAVAVRKARTVAAAGATVTLVAPELSPAVKRLRGVRTAERPYRVADLRGKRLVFTATDDEELNGRIAAAAKRRGLWVNTPALPDAGNFVVPATLRRGLLTAAFSTGGASPAAAAALRKKLEREIVPEWAVYLRLLEVRRRRLLREEPSPARRRAVLKELGAAEKWLDLLRRAGVKETAGRMDKAAARKRGVGGRSESSARRKGRKEEKQKRVRKTGGGAAEKTGSRTARKTGKTGKKMKRAKGATR